jgi:hypothetical protein
MMWGMKLADLILASISGDSLGGLVNLGTIVVGAVLGAALGSRSKHKATGMIAGLFSGAAMGLALFWVAILLTGWWPISEGP